MIFETLETDDVILDFKRREEEKRAREADLKEFFEKSNNPYKVDPYTGQVIVKDTADSPNIIIDNGIVPYGGTRPSGYDNNWYTQVQQQSNQLQQQYSVGTITTAGSLPMDDNISVTLGDGGNYSFGYGNSFTFGSPGVNGSPGSDSITSY